MSRKNFSSRGAPGTDRRLLARGAGGSPYGAAMIDVVRTRMFVTDISRWEEIEADAYIDS